MDFRVRILLLHTACFSISGAMMNSVEEIPPPLQQQQESSTSALPVYLNNSVSTVPEREKFSNITVVASSVNDSVLHVNDTKLASPNTPTSAVAVRQIVTTPSAAAPEFEDRNEPDEGGKGDEDPDANIDDGANAAPPADNEAAGEGVAKEDTEPLKGKDKDENQLGAMVEDAKGNVAVPPKPQFQPRIDFTQSEDSYFMTFFVVGGMLVFCLYLLHHNKKKILGLIFEGRASAHPRRNVRYRRLSQREEQEKGDIA